MLGSTVTLIQKSVSSKAATTTAAAAAAEAASSSSSSILTNYPLISAVVAFTIAQSIKFFTTWYV